MYEIKAIYDGVNFKPKQPISVTEPHEVLITFVEPLDKKSTALANFKKTAKSIQERSAANGISNMSMDEIDAEIANK